jgi:hypothetical protein
MNFEQTVESIRTWLVDLSTTVDRLNAGFDSGKLTMPRDKDLSVTFRGDEESKPEQLPAAVLELEDGASDGSNNTSMFKGFISGTLYVVDEAGSMSGCRTKLTRWVDAVNAHCSAPTAIVGSYSRVNLRGMSFNLSKDAGDIHTLVVRFDLLIPTVF